MYDCCWCFFVGCAEYELFCSERDYGSGNNGNISFGDSSCVGRQMQQEEQEQEEEKEEEGGATAAGGRGGGGSAAEAASRLYPLLLVIFTPNSE
jgi:hypothetical protein